jgi:hypothetical protein
MPGKLSRSIVSSIAPSGISAKAGQTLFLGHLRYATYIGRDPSPSRENQRE